MLRGLLNSNTVQPSLLQSVFVLHKSKLVLLLLFASAHQGGAEQGIMVFQHATHVDIVTCWIILTVSREMLSSMTSLASDTKEMVAELEMAPPFGASFRLKSASIQQIRGKQRC